MSEQPKQLVAASIIFKNIGALLKAGTYPGELAEAVSEAIKFCTQVTIAEEAKEKALSEAKEGQQ